MKFKKALLDLMILVFIIGMVTSSGCFDVHSARSLLFEENEEEIEMVRGTIAQVRYNFTGGIGQQGISVRSNEFHREIDNFHLGKGGGSLYVYAQVHFGADTERNIEFERWIEVNLMHRQDGEWVQMILPPPVFMGPSSGTKDVAEIVAQIPEAESGLWSLNVFGNGTASDTAEVPFYDWFLVNVNGIYSDESYNNNSP